MSLSPSLLDPSHGGDSLWWKVERCKEVSSAFPSRSRGRCFGFARNPGVGQVTSVPAHLVHNLACLPLHVRSVPSPVFLDYLGIPSVDFEFQSDPLAEYGVCECTLASASRTGYGEGEFEAPTIKPRCPFVHVWKHLYVVPSVGGYSSPARGQRQFCESDPCVSSSFQRRV